MWRCRAKRHAPHDAFGRPSGAEVRFGLDESWGSFGIGRESFDRPVDVAVDRDDHKYVVDYGNNRIQVLDRTTYVFPASASNAIGRTAGGASSHAGSSRFGSSSLRTETGE